LRHDHTGVRSLIMNVWITGAELMVRSAPENYEAE